MSFATGPIASPLLIGSLLNFFFFGTLLVQVYIYHTCFPKDSRRVKCLVYFLLLAMTVNTCLNALDVKFWYATSFGDLAIFANPRYSAFYSPIMGSVIATVVHLFFCYRIFVIKRAVWPLCILISLVTMAQLSGGMGSGILSFIQEYKVHDSNSKDLTGLHDYAHTVLIYLWLTGGPVADVLIAMAMTTLLLRADMHSATRDVVKSIVSLILETNTFSAAVALVALFVFIGFPDAPYSGCPLLILPGIYANTLLATLNNRAILLRAKGDESTSAYSGQMSGGACASAPPATAALYGARSAGSVETLTAMSFEPTNEENQAARPMAPPSDAKEGQSINVALGQAEKSL
ncbi:hypothetical protein B0H14DRAFT_3451460 [Mycena olivaceomarginata]|nr:hypothetical protein B0H14DRAFT_3451460 [Mycena olivaceomarginata]